MGWRICGENLFYKHTIPYRDLDTVFYVYSIWNEANECLLWADTLECCRLLDLRSIPVVYEGTYDRARIIAAFQDYTARAPQLLEGFVVRRTAGFAFGEFRESVAKYVHDSFRITTTQHWKYAVKEMNQLKNQRNVWEIYC